MSQADPLRRRRPPRSSHGRLAVLADRAAAGPLEVILFDGAIGAGQDRSDRDEAMARRLLAAAPAQARTLAVAGNAHTSTSPIDLDIPMGAWLHRQRPRMREIRINYGSGRYYNSQPCRFAHHSLPPHPDPAPPTARLARPRPSHGAGGDRAPQIREMSVKGN